MSYFSQPHKYHKVFYFKIQPQDIKLRLRYFKLHRKTISIHITGIILCSLEVGTDGRRPCDSQGGDLCAQWRVGGSEWCLSYCHPSCVWSPGCRGGSVWRERVTHAILDMKHTWLTVAAHSSREGRPGSWQSESWSASHLVSGPGRLLPPCELLWVETQHAHRHINVFCPCDSSALIL